MVSYNNFESLKANEIEGTDYRINLKKRDPDILIMAPHGGDIEPTTSKIADLISGEDYSLYTFEGLKASEEENNKLHIESHLFDEQQAIGIVKKAKIVVTIQRQEDQNEEFVMVGGLHRDLMSKIQVELNAMCFITKPPTQKYLGNNPLNICNRGTLKQGVQLEISRKLRNRLNEDENYL